MKVALVILHADPARGGAERYTIDLAAALARGGHDVSLLATSFADVPAGVTTVALEHRGFTRASRYDGFLDALDGQLGRTAYDVVHAMLPVRRCDVYHPHAGLAVAKERQTGLRLAFNPRRKAMADVERALLTGASPPLVLSLSDYVKQDILRHYPDLPDERLATLFNAVDLDYFTAPADRTATSRTTINALIVAQDFERKGLLEAIEAAAMIPYEQVRLSVVGSEASNRYRRYAFELGLPINFVGFARDTRPHYAAADFFVLPTKHDPCSLVVLEALAMGLPVISTRFNGACEVMTDGVHGFVLDDPNDIDALADAMRELLDPSVRARMSRACHELRPRLSYDHHLRALMDIYDRARTASATRGKSAL